MQDAAVEVAFHLKNITPETPIANLNWDRAVLSPLTLCLLRLPYLYCPVVA